MRGAPILLPICVIVGLVHGLVVGYSPMRLLLQVFVVAPLIAVLLIVVAAYLKPRRR